ncbi:PIN domain-containing protein [Methylicorpusculum oleiharenae]|uniref:PIN domain-containing protein n=1 Tax=Methylicorpusculum oleiharenae TaxID=1338687 RepID=UPI0013599E35|nr:PIN domain-containing protein [Methylicorpusculum oleiharenae]MCD2450782.1 PIN domain-containing protein [Methylicorpusculum oleiharenae]
MKAVKPISKVKNSETVKELSRVLMIDLENCPGQIDHLLDDLVNYSHIVICYAQSGAKVPLSWINPLTASVNDNKLKIFQMPSGGKNSADFGIAFWAGVLMVQLAEHTRFDIVSNDTDLDHVVSLLNSQNRDAERIGRKKESVEPVRFTVDEANQADYFLQAYCLHLMDHHKSRPAKKETLLNNIKSKFKSNQVDPEFILDILKKNGVIELDLNNKVRYSEALIANFSESDLDDIPF